ncbi:MAG: DUF4386 domain-containing protein [Gammaproteobacteria bacterium]|nr:DUF4386 domain-containing protein [Gammaproteobacteria bacterium]MDH5652558.1 DUF4386 domain-containing protein [Gammaproteobacteria bacterium]
MDRTLRPGTLSLIAGVGYLIIFVAAMFANFFSLELIRENPVAAVQQNHIIVRAGILAFMITVVFDIVVAWALYELFKEHALSGLSTLFRMTHAVIMGVAVFALPRALALSVSEDILNQVDIFNTIWLIGLFFFGIHLILLGNIIDGPKIIAIFLVIAGAMYMVDTAAHFLLPNYENYSSVFLALVAVPSIIGEMSFSIWLLIKARRSG